MQASFDSARIVVFSGGGANGSIIGRNRFRRPKPKALAMLRKIIDIYLGDDREALRLA